jgi:2',3'-cyclic-nucleotide 2'-phosphodiesterase (5'-nucleotidase family)
VRRAAIILALGLMALGAPRPSGFSRSLLPQQDDRREAAEQNEASSPRARTPLTILQINDVYSTVPIDGAGGLSRVATLKQNLAAAGRTPLLVLAGDFLSPSVASSVFKGEQMVATLNAAGLDLATLGNHEFDFGSDLLIKRMGEARWQWVISNVIDTNTGKPVGGAPPYLVKTFGTLKVGFIGLCLTTSEISRDKLTHLRLVDPIEAAGRYLPALRREGANVIVAITHLKFTDDRALARRFPQIDLIIGGHEHYPITATENRTLISKAGSDAKFVARIDVNRQPSGVVERFFELVPITSALADEPRTAAVVKSYEDRLGTELNTVVATSRVPLDADTRRLRARETNLGDLFADAMRAAANADIAIVNAGSIRGDRMFPAGALTRRTVLEMHPFGGFICKVAVPGRIVLQALNSGVSKLPATAGQFPQVSGLTLRVAPDAAVGRRVSDVRVGGQPLDPDKIYTAAITDYMLMGGDDYTMFANQPVLIGPEGGDLIVTALEKYLTARGEVAPAADGRIATGP